MNLSEKKDLLGAYCSATDCDKCVLAGREWDHVLNPETCLEFASATEKEVDLALAIINGDDPVNHPYHYNGGKIEVIDFIEDQKLGFCLGNAVKYIARAGKKDPTKEVEDLKKAAWYVDRRIKEVEEGLA